jgi:hypothetical protein
VGQDRELADSSQQEGRLAVPRKINSMQDHLKDLASVMVPLTVRIEKSFHKPLINPVNH